MLKYEEKATETNGRYEDENLDFLNLQLEQKEQLAHNKANNIKRVTKDSKEDIRVLEKLSEWENYVKENKI